MINRLINMDIPKVNHRTLEITPLNGLYSIKDYANSFINGMSDTQRIRFKKMLENNIKCGMSVAENYGINYDDFISEVKKQIGVV